MPLYAPITNKLATPMQWRTTFYVEGSGHFPIDMLRRDHCIPADDRDWEAVMSPECRDQRRVRLVKLHSGKDPMKHLTPERWLSFGWAIL